MNEDRKVSQGSSKIFYMYGHEKRQRKCLRFSNAQCNKGLCGQPCGTVCKWLVWNKVAGHWLDLKRAEIGYWAETIKAHDCRNDQELVRSGAPEKLMNSALDAVRYGCSQMGESIMYSTMSWGRDKELINSYPTSTICKNMIWLRPHTVPRILGWRGKSLNVSRVWGKKEINV